MGRFATGGQDATRQTIPASRRPAPAPYRALVADTPSGRVWREAESLFTCRYGRGWPGIVPIRLPAGRLSAAE